MNNLRIYKHNWYLKNKKRLLKLAILYRKTHKKEYYEYRKRHKKEIAKRMKIYGNKYVQMRIKLDINYKLVRNLRRRLHHALNGNLKFEKTITLLSCSMEQLKRHLENKFTKGMSFSNYGKWHIDHIRPCASFDLSKVSEQKKCFHYTNLQPLWAEENLKKSKK